MSAVKSLLRRVFRFSSTNEALDKEIHRIKQTLINNGFSNKLIDEAIEQYRHKYNTTNTSHTTPIKNTQATHKVFYMNQMHTNYIIDEHIIKNPVKQNTKCITPNHLII